MRCVLDSSAIIPLINTGNLNLIKNLFEETHITESVWNEIVVEGEKLGKPISAFKDGRDSWYKVSNVKEKEKVKRIAGEMKIQEADAESLLLAKEKKCVLIVNDKALVHSAQAYNVEAWWLTTLILVSIKKRIITKEKGERILLDFVRTGVYLRPNLLVELLFIIKGLRD